MEIKSAKLCLTMIMKNESHIIERTLNNIYRYLTDYVVVDTGSTDNSIALVERFFKSKNIPGQVFRKPWVNFGHNRTEAFQLTRATSNSDYMWVFDADDFIVGESPRVPLLFDSYVLQFQLGETFISEKANLQDGY